MFSLTRSFAVLLCLAAMIMPVHAVHAMTGAEWQKQLQAEMRKMVQTTPSLTINGNVTVAQKGDEWVANLPVMTILSPSETRYVIPSIRLTTRDLTVDPVKVTVRFPERMGYYDKQGQERGSVTIASQNISGLWHMQDHYFTDLTGVLGNVVYRDTIKSDTTTSARSQAGIAQITIDATDGRRPQFTATKIQSITQEQDVVIRSSVQNAVLRYQFGEEDKMTLPRLLGMINPVWLLTERNAFTIDMVAKNLMHIDRTAQSLVIEDISTRVQVLPSDKADILGGRINMVLQQIRQQPESSYGFILPTKLTMMGTLHDMPVQILTHPYGLMRHMMVESGTRADISEIIWETAGRAKLQGTGWLRVADDVPLGVVGRFTLSVDDLRALSAALQKQLTFPGTDLKTKTQGFMILMLLQSFAKSDGTSTKIILDMTPDGQVLVNNQDISALVMQVARKNKAP